MGTPKVLAIILQIVGALPLCLYPAVLMAGIMSLAGERDDTSSRLLTIIAQTFLLGSLAYPVVFLGCCLGAWIAFWRRGERGGVALSGAPLVYLLALGVLFSVWSALSK